MQANTTDRERKRAGWALVIGLVVGLAGLLIVHWGATVVHWGATVVGMMLFSLGACTAGAMLGRLWRLGRRPR